MRDSARKSAHNADLSRADLLRALNAVAEETRPALADLLGFVSVPKKGQVSQFYLEPSPLAEIKPEIAEVAAPNLPREKRVPLRAPMFGIVAIEELANDEDPSIENSEENAAQTAIENQQLQPLEAADFAPEENAYFYPQTLVADARLARRLREQLAPTARGRKLAIAQAVRLLARAQFPRQLPMQTWAQTPEHVYVFVDRSLHLRPYWWDQNQIVAQLVRWLGAANLTTYTVQGDPWYINAAWSRGKVLQQVQRIQPLPDASVVLLLSDMACLHASGVAHAQLARWQQAASVLGAKGARVLACPPCHAHDLPAQWWAQLALMSGPARAHTCRRTQAGAHEALQTLLAMLACARRIEPELVRALRRLDPRTAHQPALEALIWSRSDLFEIGYDVCVWRPSAVMEYRAEFEKLNAPQQLAVLGAMRQVHAVRGRAIAVQETVLWAAHAIDEARQVWEDDIAEAKLWLQRLGAADEALTNPSPGLAAFARQAWDFHVVDDAVTQDFGDAVGTLWAIASVGRGDVETGALPLAVRQRLRPQALAPAKTWILQQRGMELLIAPKLLPRSSPMGMPLKIRELTVLSLGEDKAVLSQSKFATLEEESYVLARLQAGAEVQVRTDQLGLTVGSVGVEVGPLVGIDPRKLPSGEASIRQLEQGRDEYGMYLDLVIYGVTQRFRYIEPGRFLMGSPESEVGRDANEGPQHSVLMSDGYWMADTACTQEIWHVVMGEYPSDFSETNGGSPQHPVERVSWYDAQKFSQKLAPLLVDWYFALPSETEWEYACRAGTATAYSFGDFCSSEQANINGNHPFGDAPQGQWRASTVVVKEFPANPWGLYQMHGNVWEWCAELWRADYTQAVHLARGVDQDKDRQVLRGGSWFDKAQDVRSAYRGQGRAGRRGSDTGCRFVLRSSP